MTDRSQSPTDVSTPTSPIQIDLVTLSELDDLAQRRCLSCNGLVREPEQVLATDVDHPDYEDLDEDEIRETYGIPDDEDIPTEGVMRSSILPGDKRAPLAWYPPDRGQTTLDHSIGRYCDCGSSRTKHEADLHRSTLSNGELFEAMDGVIAALTAGDIPFDRHLLEGIVKASRKEFDQLSGHQFSVLKLAVKHAQIFAWSFPFIGDLALPVTNPPTPTSVARMADTDRLVRRQVFEPGGGGIGVQVPVRSSPNGSHSVDLKRRQWIDKVIMLIHQSASETDSESVASSPSSPYRRDNYHGTD